MDDEMRRREKGKGSITKTPSGKFNFFLCFLSLIFTNRQKDKPLYKDQ